MRWQRRPSGHPTGEKCSSKFAHLSSASFQLYGTDHVCRQVHSVSVQPVDWKASARRKRRFVASLQRGSATDSHQTVQIQDYGVFVKSYPFVLGSDVAGEVVEVGDGVANLRKGDRVLGYVHLSRRSREREERVY